MYNLPTLISAKYDPVDFAVDYQKGTPVPWLYFDDFLPTETLKTVQKEINEIPKYIWSHFTRNGSRMAECNNLSFSPAIRDLVLNLNSSEFVRWLEVLTGHHKLIPDPHLIGAGLMRCTKGDSLKLHTDYNWNEQLQLNRSINVILYIHPEWDESWNGGLELWDFERKEKLHTVACKSNRLLIWDYHSRLFHGHPIPLTCPDGTTRDGLRLFYFNSNSTPAETPHRSLYWIDEETRQPYDIRENK
jgi:hypothetical protein